MELFGFILADGFTSIVFEALAMIVTLLAPFVVFALIIHWFERVTQQRLAERFGWRSVMFTGWLGTPIHELSHAAMCKLFGHRIDDIALFEPDRESGRLGYVKHSFRRGNWFQEIGNLFIGVAPLIGGSIALAALLWLFYPDAAAAAVKAAQFDSNDEAGNVFLRTWEVASQITGEILSLQNLGTARFWIFIYLVLCVGSHMAPSWSDYRGASRGVWLAGGLLLGVSLLMAAVGVDLSSVSNAFIGAAGPLYAILGLTVLLCFIATVFVYLFTSIIPRSFRVR